MDYYRQNLVYWLRGTLLLPSYPNALWPGVKAWWSTATRVETMEEEFDIENIKYKWSLNKPTLL